MSGSRLPGVPDGRGRRRAAATPSARRFVRSVCSTGITIAWPTVANLDLVEAMEAPSYVFPVPDRLSPVLIARHSWPLTSTAARRSREAERRAYCEAHSFREYARQLYAGLSLETVRSARPSRGQSNVASTEVLLDISGTPRQSAAHRYSAGRARKSSALAGAAALGAVPLRHAEPTLRLRPDAVFEILGSDSAAPGAEEGEQLRPHLDALRTCPRASCRPGCSNPEVFFDAGRANAYRAVCGRRTRA